MPLPVQVSVFGRRTATADPRAKWFAALHDETRTEVSTRLLRVRYVPVSPVTYPFDRVCPEEPATHVKMGAASENRPRLGALARELSRRGVERSTYFSAARSAERLVAIYGERACGRGGG